MTTLLSNRLRDPFTFATNSEHNGGGDYGKGMYPVKLYNSSSVLIYQEDNGGDNSGKLPSGGVIAATVASSMSVAIANPITFYWGAPQTVINQDGQSGDIYNYYWTSYSRGTDGAGGAVPNNPSWHNDYLDSYIPSRHKSIYDPCPYGYRIPSNGTYNEFTNTGWITHSYTGGVTWDKTWMASLGYRSEIFDYLGSFGFFFSSNCFNKSIVYILAFNDLGDITINRSNQRRFRAISVRCIEDCSVVSDATEASKQKK